MRVEDLAKSYPAFELRDVSFSVEAGTITGFIGRNGAGKSTTLKCLEGAVHPDGGTIEYFGKPYLGNEDTIKEQVGFELNSADFYRTKRLSLIASITSNFYANWSDDAYARYCKLFNLDQKKRIMDLSQGMRVKFALALALSHNARLLILDEPTSGLDPASREEVLDILLKLARSENVGVLFSTHITSDLEKCASNILYIDNGNIIGKGSLSEFKDRYRVAPLDAAQRADTPICGIRETANGTSALVPARSGIGDPATLDDIPSWMYGAIFIYGVLVAFFNGMNAREMHDLEYSFSLPLSRASMTRARILTMIGIETIMLAIMVAFIALRGPLGINAIAPPSEAVGTAANLYLVTLGFITFGMFNLVFYPLHYRDPLKVGLPFIIASIPAALCITATVVLPYLPFANAASFDIAGFNDPSAQLCALAAGLVVFIVCNVVACKLSARSFTHFDA